MILSVSGIRLALLPMVTALAIAPCEGPLAAQTRPSFNGTWTQVGSPADGQRTTVVAESGDAAFRIGDMGTGWGNPLTMTQQADRFIVSYTYFSAYDLMAPLRFEFALDGRETRQEVVIGPGVTRLQSRAEWRGDSLVLLTRQPVPPEVAPAGVLAEVSRTLVLQAPDTLRMIITRAGIGGAPTNRLNTLFARTR
jgi:hypothetical protein